MIRKDKLDKQLAQFVEIKKNLIPLVNRHISSSLFFSNMPKKDYQKTLQRFQEITITLNKHIEILNDIKSEIKASDNDVF